VVAFERVDSCGEYQQDAYQGDEEERASPVPLNGFSEGVGVGGFAEGRIGFC